MWATVIGLTLNGFYWVCRQYMLRLYSPYDFGFQIGKANNDNANFVRETRELQIAIYPYRKVCGVYRYFKTK